MSPANATVEAETQQMHEFAGEPEIYCEGKLWSKAYTALPISSDPPQSRYETCHSMLGWPGYDIALAPLSAAITAVGPFLVVFLLTNPARMCQIAARPIPLGETYRIAGDFLLLVAKGTYYPLQKVPKVLVADR